VSFMARFEWIRFSERAFSFNFIAFCLVMFSCWFPTGFSAVFSSFAFIFALPIFLDRLNWRCFSLFERFGLVLFGWLGLSIFWSEIGFIESIPYLLEYRLYFMLPVFSVALSSLPNTQTCAFCAAIAGAIIAMVTSYGLGFGWWTIEGAQLSLANRIYHGFIMSSLLLASLLLARHLSGILKIMAVVVACLAAYNVLNIETGRTGYFQVIAVALIFVILTFRRLTSLVLVLGAVMLCFMAYQTFDKFNTRVNQTIANVERMIVDDDYYSSSGYRIEFYRIALQIGTENPLGGVGVGDVTSELSDRVVYGQLRVPTDNLHSEYMNMLVAGGVPALVLFVGFLLSVTRVGYQYRDINRLTGEALIGIATIICVSALFNSTVKDYGEKHAVLIMLSLMASRLLADRRRANASHPLCHEQRGQL